MRNTEQREGFVNRHTEGLPDKKCLIMVVTKGFSGEHISLCEWKPFDKSQYTETTIPAEGYLGTATTIDGEYKGIGFHAWEQNNSEFVWYKPVVLQTISERMP